MDASIRSIREGKFLKALVREEIHQDKDWVIRLRTLPDAPETFYLTALMASHDFQTALQNYLDLEDLRRKLVTWQGSFDAFDDMIRLRRANYEPLLPEIDAQFRELDSQMRLRIEQRDHLRKRLQDMLTAPRPELLATADERIALERIRSVEKAIAGVPEEQRAELQERVQHLKGVLIWTLRTEYPERLTQAHKHLRELQQDIDVLTAQYDAFVRTRQAAVHSYVGYDAPISRLRTRVGAALEQVDMLMARQGALIETVAINELKARAERLEAYQTQARYAVADSYDRATKAQAEAAGGTAVMRRSPPGRNRDTRARAGRLCGPSGQAHARELHRVPADTTEVKVEDGLDKAMQSYRRFLDETPEGAMTPEAMRRLADLKLEKEYGILGDGKIVEVEPVAERRRRSPRADRARGAGRAGAHREDRCASCRQDAPRRDSAGRRDGIRARTRTARDGPAARRSGRVRGGSRRAGRCWRRSREARVRSRRSSCTTRCSRSIRTTRTRDQVLYQKARAYDELGRTDEAMKVMERLIAANPRSRYIDEVQFRRAEHFFTRKKFRDAENCLRSRSSPSDRHPSTTSSRSTSSAGRSTSRSSTRRPCTSTSRCSTTRYRSATTSMRSTSPKRSGASRTPSRSSASASRTSADRRSSASTSRRTGTARYEDRVYRNFGEFYLDEAALPRRRQGLQRVRRALSVPRSRAALQHARDRDLRAAGSRSWCSTRRRSSRATTGFRANTGGTSTSAKSPEVLSYLKANLKDLANHYHAQYQDKEQAEGEAGQLRRGLALVSRVPRVVPRRSGGAADQLSARRPAAREQGLRGRGAGVRAHGVRLRDARESGGRRLCRDLRSSRVPEGRERRGEGSRRARDTVTSSLKFADTFPEHEHAPAVLGAAAEDLYEMKDFALARSSARKLLEQFPKAAAPLRRTAWLVDRALVVRARRVPRGRSGVRTGARRNAGKRRVARRRSSRTSRPRSTSRASRPTRRGDFRAAADHFLRIKQSAPTSKIRAAAEYDAGAALIRLQDWTAAADVLERVPPDLSRARAAEGSHEADRVRLSPGRRACAVGGRVRARRQRSRPIRSCAPRRCCWRASCTSSRRARIARSPRTRATSSSSRSRSRQRWRRASRSRKYTRAAATTRSIEKSSRRSFASTRPPAASERGGRATSPRARRWFSPSRSTTALPR